MRITPYGQLRWQLPQPMQVSSIDTSPSGPRWIALGGQSAMQCGCSQCRQTGRDVDVRVGAPRLAVEPRQPVMAVGARFLAIVAADAELLVDQQHVGRFADAVVDQEVGDRRIHVDRARKLALARLDMRVDLLPRRHVRARPGGERGIAREQPREGIAVELDQLGFDRGAHRRDARAAVDQRHLAEIATRGQIVEEDRFSADLPSRRSSLPTRTT